MRILYVYADGENEWNCSQWRCLSPADVINARSKVHSAKLLWLQSFADFANPAVADIVGPADVIIVQRNFITPDVWDAMDYWRGLGKTIVADLDDDYPNLPWSNPAHRFWIENASGWSVPPVELMTQGLRHCDALTSPSRVICADWQAIVPGLHLPNYAHGAWWSPPPRPSPVRKDGEQGRVIVGWGGSVSHYDSWWFSGAREALERVVKERTQVLVKVCGNDPRLYDQLDVPAENKVQQPGVAAHDWPKIVATFDIGLAPLDLREGLAAYDQRRSWIKGLEYMLAGVPWIASSGEPYRDLVQYGTMVENSPAAWAEALVAMIDHLDEARKAARQNRPRALNWTLEANVARVIGVYEKAQLLRQARPGLPQVFYVKAGNKSQVASPRPQVAERSDDTTRNEERLGRIQRAAVTGAQQWADGLGLTLNGVDLAEPMAYDVIQRLNMELIESARAIPEQELVHG